MRPSFRTLLCLPLLAGAVGAFLLARAGLAGLDPDTLTEPWPLSALDQDHGDEIGRAHQRGGAKEQVIAGLLDGWS
jgi:hypothetical protein